jgi:hypothetical protein
VSADYAGREPWKSLTNWWNLMRKHKRSMQAQWKPYGTKTVFAGGFLWKHHAEEGRRGYEKRFTPKVSSLKSSSEAYSKY